MRTYKRGDTYYVDYSHKGRRVRRAVGHSEKMAKLKLKDVELKIERQENLGIHDWPRILFRKYSSEYLNYTKANKAPGTVKRERVALKRLNRTFGNKYVSSITSRQVEQYKKRRIDEGVKAGTINKELGTLRHMLNKAIEWGYIGTNPLKGVKMLKEPPGRTRFLEPQEIQALLKESAPHLRPIVVTALNTGMRLSEILTLEWSNVNMRLRIITIDKSKNNERRIIPINETLYQELEKLKPISSYVFCRDDGKPYVVIHHGFKAACRRAGIVDFRFHDLRHTFASHLVMAGVNLRAVQQLLGHKRIEMTMRYSHLSRQHLQEAVGLLGLSLTGEIQRQMREIWHKSDTRPK